jgi:hypothetical protein
MTTITPPDYSASAGIPTQWQDDIAVTLEGFVTGNEPAVLTTDRLVAASQTILARTPVGLDGSGNLVPAISGTTQAIGLTVTDVTTDSSGTLKGAPIYAAGCFNPAMINWPASYDTAAKQFGAFRGAPTPTNIVIRAVKTATVVLP